MKSNLQLLYVDDELLVLNKPALIASIPERHQPNLINLFKQAELQFGRLFINHRLDKETSGVICFSRTPESHRAINLQFQENQVRKHYLAWVKSGIQDSGRIESALTILPSGLMKVARKGKLAITEFEVRTRFDEYSLLDVYPKTGRTHQIRVHLASLGFPILADPLYGDGTALFLSAIKKKYHLGKFAPDEKPLLARTALHAASLTIQHPLSGANYTWEAPLPKDLRALNEQLNKHGKIKLRGRN